MHIVKFEGLRFLRMTKQDFAIRVNASSELKDVSCAGPEAVQAMQGTELTQHEYDSM